MTGAIPADRPGGAGAAEAPVATAHDPMPPVRRGLPPWLRTALPVLVPLVIVLVGAWVYRWVDEDAFIDFRVIDNLLAGHGLLYNVGERVEADSDPLWLLSLAGLHEVFPFVALEWLSVVVGLVCTGLGFVTGARGAQRLVGRREPAGRGRAEGTARGRADDLAGRGRAEGAARGRADDLAGPGRAEGTAGRDTVVWPVGLLIVSVVAGVWEFATSGLEMSMVYLWLGLTFTLLVRLEGHRRGACLPAFVLGLGTLVRPELALMSVVFLAAVVVVVAAPGWAGPRGRLRRYVAPVLSAVAVPVAFELFRMAYYALLVPNTGLAKAAGSSWWSQGTTYLWNFVAPYTLWLPLLLAVPVVASRVWRWWRAGDRVGVVVLAAPLVAGLVDALYVVGIGGDYMHARLLLPAFFALCLPVVATPVQARSLLALPLAGIVVWSVVSVGWLRPGPGQQSLNPQVVGVSDQRDAWVAATGDTHPVTAADYDRALSGKVGHLLRRAAGTVPAGEQRLLVVTDPYAPVVPSRAEPARSPLPFTLAVNLPAIGVIGYLAGPEVYVFDEFSLANPVGSHTTIIHRARPGHEKLVGAAWMVGRFGTAAERSSSKDATAAARALACDPLRSYLEAVTAPMTWSRAFSNIAHSFGYTAMSFSADPTRAAAQLCGGPTGGSEPPGARAR